MLDRLDQEERSAARRHSGHSRTPGSTIDGTPIALNDAVEVGTLGGKVGRVLDLRGREAVVAVGSIKLTVPLATLRRTDQPAEQAVSYVALPDTKSTAPKAV